MVLVLFGDDNLFNLFPHFPLILSLQPFVLSRSEHRFGPYLASNDIDGIDLFLINCFLGHPIDLRPLHIFFYLIFAEALQRSLAQIWRQSGGDIYKLRVFYRMHIVMVVSAEVNGELVPVRLAYWVQRRREIALEVVVYHLVLHNTLQRLHFTSVDSRQRRVFLDLLNAFLI